MSHETGQDRTTRRLGLRIDYYATQHHLSIGAVRKRIQRGQLDAYKGSDHRWYVLGDVARDETGQDTGQDRTRHDATPAIGGAVAVNPNARAQLEAIRDEWLAPLVAQITEQAERIGHLEAEREELRRRAEAAEIERGDVQQLVHNMTNGIETCEETIAELRRRAEAAEAERDALRAQAAPQPPSETSPESAQAEASAPQMPAQGFWQLIRRVFGGD